MRISDWSSDVCSSDLPRLRKDGAPGGELALVVGVLVADPLDRAVLAGRGRRLPPRTQTIEEAILHDSARMGLAEGTVDGLLAIDLLLGFGGCVVGGGEPRDWIGTDAGGS